MSSTTDEQRTERAAEASPGPRLPDIPGPGETALLVWRRLRKMSTALLLLFALAAASIVATFVPQEPIIPTTVESWRTGAEGPGEAAASAFDVLGFFDVFGSWWFATLTVLLFVSLTGCLVPRWGAFARTVRKPPVPGQRLHRLSHQAHWDSDLEPEQALAAAERVLRRRRFRRRRVTVDGDVPQLAAERGHWREGGSLLFHSAFYVLLASVIYAHSTGFIGQVNIVEGSSFTDTRISYDLVEPGRYFDVGDHRGFEVTLDAFHVAFYDNFIPSDFASTITISEDGEPVRTEELRVNHPVTHDGMRIYQARWGMAPRVTVTSGDTVLFNDAVMLTEENGGFIWTGAAKVAVGDQTLPDPPPQIALELVFLPDADLTDDGRPFSRSPEPNNPRLVALLHTGELGLERAVPATRADLSEDSVTGPPAILSPGTSGELAAGAMEISFDELDRWSGFQVSRPPGRWLLLSAGGLILAGLIPSLYSYRRRFWVEARPSGAGSSVTLAGVALQRKDAFVEEFAGIRQAVNEAVPAAEDRQKPPASEDP